MDMNKFLDRNGKHLAKSLLKSPVYQELDKSMIDEKLSTHHKQRKVTKEEKDRDHSYDEHGNKRKTSAIEMAIVATIVVKKAISSLNGGSRK